MGSNTNLTPELAIKLIRGDRVTCPNCQSSALTARYRWKKENTEFKCEACGEIYHPGKLI